jgi:hypothetical protein
VSFSWGCSSCPLSVFSSLYRIGTISLPVIKVFEGSEKATLNIELAGGLSLSVSVSLESTIHELARPIHQSRPGETLAIFHID